MRRHPFSLDDAKRPMALRERFWKAVDKSTDQDGSGCWGWLGSITLATGYGHVDFVSKGSGKSERISAHRYSWTIHHGSIPDGLFVCHHCDNPPCTNPAHLFVGTTTDNMRDSIRKGRHNSFGVGKLNAEQVQSIRRLARDGCRHWEIAAQFGVTRKNVTKILNGKSWAHLSESVST